MAVDPEMEVEDEQQELGVGPIRYLFDVIPG